MGSVSGWLVLCFGFGFGFVFVFVFVALGLDFGSVELGRLLGH